MLCCKKILNTDLLQLALAVILLRLTPQDYLNNRWNDNLEVREIFLGANSAYIQSNFHTSRGRLRPYAYPKNIDSIFLDEALSVFEDINYHGSLNQFRYRRNDFLAFYSSSDQSQDNQRGTESSDISHQGQEAPVNEFQENSNSDNGVCSETQSSAAQNQSEGNVTVPSVNLDLTREDMDLIEILWKQDIDLGLSRDAFDMRESHDVEKLKPSQNHKELKLEENFDDLKKFQDQAASFSDPWEGLNYTIDSETGEHIIQEPLPLEDIPEVNDEESLFSEEILNELSENLHLPLPDGEEFMSLTSNETFLDLFQSYDNDVPSDPENMLSQLDKLEKMIKKEGNLTYMVEDQEMVSDLFSSTEDCWQDITTTLPLSVVGSTHNGASLSLFTRPSQPYSGIMSNNSLPVLSNPANASDSSNGILIHNATLASPASDMNNSISYISTTLGPSSIGCAVAASMATLTNDTEPVPDGSMVNTTYHSEFTELIYPNHTSVSTQGEYLLTDFLLDEDLQLTDMGNSTEVSANYANHLGVVGEHMDASSDSAVSLTSGRVPSISDCPDWVDSCSDSSHQGERDNSYLSIEASLPLALNSSISRSFPNHQNSHQYSTAFPPSIAQKKYKLFGKKATNGAEEGEHESNGYKGFNSRNCPKDELYVSVKHASNELAVASSYGPGHIEGATASHDQDFGMNIPVASGGSYVQYPQHNHSYHLPFVSSSYIQKPLMRDKTKNCSGDDEPLNRDEKRARALKLPITIDDIINLAIDEFNEKLTKYELTEPQMTLIRDIRRRGKNKVAAQNCRKRKMDQITILQQDIDLLQSERLQLETEQTQLLHQRHFFQDKYTQLYQFVAQASSQSQHSDSFHQMLPNEDIAAPSHMVALEPDKDTDLNRGARTKRKLEKK